MGQCEDMVKHPLEVLRRSGHCTAFLEKPGEMCLGPFALSRPMLRAFHQNLPTIKESAERFWSTGQPVDMQCPRHHRQALGLAAAGAWEEPVALFLGQCLSHPPHSCMSCQLSVALPYPASPWPSIDPLDSIEQV